MIRPNDPDLTQILDLKSDASVGDLLCSALFGPIEDLYGRPSKRVRGEMVEIGYLLSLPLVPAPGLNAQARRLCAEGSDILEAIHAGSLVVDDIQDGSKTRRGEAALHERYGVPRALNAGNWLYFWPMHKIRALELAPERELRVYQMVHSTLLRAHFGQALDVGVSIDSLPQARIPEVCMAALELKSGALVALGLSIGAVLAGESEAGYLGALSAFGHRFGIALQMFDDLGNLKTHPDAQKRREDLVNRRPSWAWAVAAAEYPAETFESFKSAAACLKDGADCVALEDWMERNGFLALARKKAGEYMDAAFADFAREFAKCRAADAKTHPGFIQAHQLAQKVTKAYG